MAVFGNNNQSNVRAITEEVETEVVRMKLNNGQDTQGNIKTVNQNIGSLNPNAWDAQKIMNIVEGLIPCLSKSVNSVQHVRTTTLID